MYLAACALGELQRTFAESEQRVVLAATDVVAGMEVSTTLTDDDLARTDLLASKHLQPRRLAWESRPLRIEPRPFLCAISIPPYN